MLFRFSKSCFLNLATKTVEIDPVQAFHLFRLKHHMIHRDEAGHFRWAFDTVNPPIHNRFRGKEPWLRYPFLTDGQPQEKSSETCWRIYTWLCCSPCWWGTWNIWSHVYVTTTSRCVGKILSSDVDYEWWPAAPRRPALPSAFACRPDAEIVHRLEVLFDGLSGCTRFVGMERLYHIPLDFATFGRPESCFLSVLFPHSFCKQLWYRCGDIFEI